VSDYDQTRETRVLVLGAPVTPYVPSPSASTVVAPGTTSQYPRYEHLSLQLPIGDNTEVVGDRLGFALYEVQPAEIVYLRNVTFFVTSFSDAVNIRAFTVWLATTKVPVVTTGGGAISDHMD
jgi:hypothetical protein